MDGVDAVADILLDGELVVVRVYPGVVQSEAQARANLARAVEARRGRRRPVLVDIRGCEPLAPPVRRIYTGPGLDPFTGLAMLVEASSFGRMTGNIYLTVAEAAIPTRLFSDEIEARRWLIDLAS